MPGNTRLLLRRRRSVGASRLSSSLQHLQDLLGCPRPGAGLVRIRLLLFLNICGRWCWLRLIVGAVVGVVVGTVRSVGVVVGFSRLFSRRLPRLPHGLPV
jgi:hypothetical protein